METYMAVNFHKPVEKDFLMQKFGCLFIKYPLHNPRCTSLIFKKSFNSKFQNEKCKISEMKFEEIIKWNQSLQSF